VHDLNASFGRVNVDTTIRRQQSFNLVWAYFCKRYGCALRLHPAGSLSPSPEEINAAELKLLIYLLALRQCYAYGTVLSYFSDLKNLQRRYAHGIGLGQLHQSMARRKLLLSVYRKEMPVTSQKKRPWLPIYFHNIVRGMGWEARPGAWRADHRHRVVWTVMVFMFEHLLRLGEVVDTKVARQAARRP
jgi:hypothetical protein